MLVLSALALGTLSGCQDRQARAEAADLRARVTALEAELGALKAQPTNAASVTPAAEVELRAAAGNCALALARDLETYRETGVEGRYPPASRVTLPTSCAGQRVNWRRLDPSGYDFSVSRGKRELARQRGGAAAVGAAAGEAATGGAAE